MCRLSSCPRRQVRCETSRPPLSLLEGSSGGLWCVELKREWPKVAEGATLESRLLRILIARRQVGAKYLDFLRCLWNSRVYIPVLCLGRFILWWVKVWRRCRDFSETVVAGVYPQHRVRNSRVGFWRIRHF